MPVPVSCDCSRRDLVSVTSLLTEADGECVAAVIGRMLHVFKWLDLTCSFHVGVGA